MEFGQDQYSCDEDELDLYDHYDTLTSVSQNVSNVTNSVWRNEDADNHVFNKPGSTVSTLSTRVSNIQHSKPSDSFDNVDTSSQVARSVVSSIFRRIVSPQIDENTNTNDSKEIDGSKASYLSQNSNNSMNSSLIIDELELRSEVASEIQSDKFKHSKNSSDEHENEDEDVGSQVSESVERLEQIDKAHNSFNERIAEWINTVTFREEAVNDSKENVTDTSIENASINNDTIETGEYEVDDDDECLSEDDEQPSAVTSPSSVMMVSNYSPNNTLDMDDEALDELRRKFRAERNSFVASSMIPSTAFQSFEQGFSNIQVANGNQLFENGTGRSRLDVLQNVPNWHNNMNMNKNYHFKLLETTEQKMKINADGTREVDTVHKKEHSEKVYDNENAYGRKIFIFVILCLLICGLMYFFQLEEIDFNCLTSKHASSTGEDVKKVFIEL